MTDVKFKEELRLIHEDGSAHKTEQSLIRHDVDVRIRKDFSDFGIRSAERLWCYAEEHVDLIQDMINVIKTVQD